MGVRISVFLICFAAAALTFPASSQVSGNRIVTAQVGDAPHNARLPYMAEFKTTQVRTLFDGTAMTSETTEVIAIDSQGRRMNATATVPTQGGQATQTHFTVFDPMTHTRISWASPGKEVTVSAVPIPAAAQPCGASWASFTVISRRTGKRVESVKTKVEDLGTETIEGVEARGQRTTTTTTRKIKRHKESQVNTFELWTAVAPGLRGLEVRVVSDDPQQGKTRRELVKFSQAEPDSSIFQMPPGYEIVNREVAMDWCPSADEVEPAAAPPQ